MSGIYSATVVLTAGTYCDVAIKDNTSAKDYSFSEFVLTETKEVTFYFDPATGIKYHNASDVVLETENIYFDSKDSNYKSVFGAVATGEEVTFTLDTGVDAVEALFVVKGMEKKALSMSKDGDAVDGVQKWSVTTSFDTIGENQYYFAVSNGSSVKIYADDDGYYGKGEVTELTSVTPYDLVVYKSGYETPDWMKDAVIYQIFPDRFFDGDESNNQAQTSARGEVDYEYIRDWYTLPENPEQEALLDEETYKSTGAHFGDGNWSNEIYGGDLEGITERIDYLKALGVNVIYLNPVFSSISSHRYDTSDYYKIDPILGDLGDFQELVRVAEENDMHVVLDGVFNHVSDDSIYFDRYYKFLGTSEKIGAYPYWAYVYDMMAEDGVSQETAEEAAKAYFTETYGITDYSYVEWFDVFTTSLKDDNGESVTDEIGLRAGKAVYGYDGWWGYDSMPIIKSTNGSEFQTGDWAEEIIYSDDKSSVTQYWITQGMDGWRLDVANEVSDETWQEFRESVKALDSDAVIIGEIWDDATEYLLGDMYDSVMNYVFRGAVTGFAKGGSSVDAMNTLEKIRERYPEEAFYAMMNLVGSHDTTRILSYLDGISDDRNEKDLASAFPTYESTSDLAKQRQYLVAFLQFTYAGAPTIYYGDEIGMVGSDDPDDRRAFEWGKGNKELVTWYATLAEIRDNYTALRTGSVEAFEVMKEDGAVNENLVAYVRRDENDTLIVVANNAQSEQEITLDLAKLNVTADELTELVSEKKVEISGTSVTVTVPALSGVILTEDAKKMSVNQEALAPAYDEKFVVAERTGEYKPETPSNPGTPSNPEAPSNPGTPSNPETPSDSEQPSTPDTPGTSDTPSTPSQDDNNSSNQQIVGNVVQNTENNVFKEEIITQGNRRYRKIAANGNAIALLADETIIPAGAKIKSVAVAAGSATYNKATQAISEQLTNTGNFVVFDIDLTTGNNVQIHELNGYVSVTMPVPENLTTADGRRIVVYRLEDDGTLTRCETTVENGMVTFVTNHFSTYIFIEEAIGAVNTGDNMAGILLLAILMLAMGAVLVRVSVVRMKKMK